MGMAIILNIFRHSKLFLCPLDSGAKITESSPSISMSTVSPFSCHAPSPWNRPLFLCLVYSLITDSVTSYQRWVLVQAVSNWESPPFCFSLHRREADDFLLPPSGFRLLEA